ncbi:EAL domain-containing protein [Photobacterium sp. TY1-4]|uniref:EAL domain-containing protein n=1 Tax=Photobacterium sp. TY1-4 TaxID=2899122 RepID=UPI0021BEB4A2|nr:EAL domain-containing protein [Photobacterium sp. TY1-4]UXI03329.1 EAL domain-containing protein [Photobacterium sp. TY1-4]
MTLQKQLFRRLVALVVVLLLTIAAQFVYSQYQQLIQQQTSLMNRHLQLATQVLATEIAQPEPRALEQRLTELAHASGWHTAQLEVLAHDLTLSFNPQAAEAVIPAWAVPFDLFPGKTQTRLITNEGAIMARLTVSSNPQAFYQQWGQTLLTTSVTLGVLLALTLIGIHWAVNQPLKPLRSLVGRADALLRNQFGAPLSLPTASDLQGLAKAINHVSVQLEKNFKTQAREAMQLREQVYRDQVSGMGNRSFFISQLNSWLTNSAQGGLALMKTSLIEACYREQGYTAGDALVRDIADGLNQSITYSDLTLARLSYDEFALLAPDISREKLFEIGQFMLSVVAQLQPRVASQQATPAHVGLILNYHASNASTLLTQLDNALSQAALSPQQPIAFVSDPDSQTAMGKQQWKALLIEAIDNDLFSYRFQPVIADQNEVYHHEVFSAITKHGQSYSASQFLGAIEDLGAGSLFDRHVLAQQINRLNADTQLGPLAINLTSTSTRDPAFIHWLNQLLDKNQALAGRLYFEIPEACFIHHPDATSLLCAAIRFYQFGFGVDHYGRHFKSLDYLTDFRPNYVKIDFAYTHQLNDPTKSQLLSSISRTAHSLDIMTIATRVETETQLERLSELFVSGFQGFITEGYRPQPPLQPLVAHR